MAAKQGSRITESIAILALCLSPFILGGLYVYATIDACGWKGFFVECRITTDCPKVK